MKSVDAVDEEETTRAEDLRVVSHVYPTYHSSGTKSLKRRRSKTTTKRQSVWKFGFKADGCLPFQVRAVANFPLSGAVTFPKVCLSPASKM